VTHTSVLDKGYVRVVDHMGNDLSAVNAARVSYDKESDTLSPRDEKLLTFLLKEGHTSPFRHAAICYEVYAPLFVARQWWKYAVASSHIDDQNGWNESSRRYITEEPVFHIPGVGEWRMKPENSKQGSGDFMHERKGKFLTARLENLIDLSLSEYEHALAEGVAPEQARLFLAAYGMYVRWRWTTSVQGVLHFLSQRLEHDAQKEIQLYAQAVHGLTEPLYPTTFKAFLGSDNNA
jgi:thymidylate synthase (FAD)